MSKRSAVLLVKKSTASGPLVRNASTRAASKLLPASAQIGPRLVRAFDNAPVARQRRAGNPQPAAGARGGAAEARLLLHDQHVEAVMPRGHRCRQSGTAGADHQRVAFVGFLYLARHAI